jgi:uncharacterized protein DUF397
MTEPGTSGIVAATWRKSSYSGSGNNCVEVATADGTPVIAIRDSKNPEGGHLTFRAAAWAAFLSDIKRGRHRL